MGKDIRTSIYGRRVGLDENDALIVRQAQVSRPVGKLNGTSDTTGTSLTNNGMVTVISSTDDTWTLDPPFPGALVTLMTGSSSTGIHSINLGSGVAAYSTQGIASTTAVLTGMGAALTLYGTSTGLWRVVSRHGSSASAYLSS